MVRKYRGFIAVLAVLCIFCVAEISAKDEWLRVRSKNFHLIGNANEKEIRKVATKLEQFRETFKKLFPRMVVDSPIETNVVVFKNSSAYKPYKPKRADGKADEWIAGYFQSGEDVNYITLSAEGQDRDIYGTIYHEYVHYLVNSSVGKSRIPPWLNEGLAEYYQTYEIAEDQKVTLGFVQDVHLQLLRQTKLIPLKQFFEIDNYSLHASGGHSRSIFYAQAWAFVHYLIQGNAGANASSFDRFVNLTLRDVEPESAFKQAFNSDFAMMEEALRKYVQAGKYTASQFSWKEKMVFDAAMTVTPLSEVESYAYLGDLLLHTGEFADAETHLNKALAADPNSNAARISLGLVKMRQRQFAEAKKHLEVALVGDQKNHFAHYNYAFILSRESVDEFGMVREYPAESLRKMKSSLLKSIELNPHYGESYRLLGFVSLVSGEDLDEALKIVNKGLSIQPGNPDYLLLTAKILLRQEKLVDARLIAEKVAKATEKKEVRAEAEGLIRSIQQFEQTKAAYEKQMKDAIAEIESKGGPANPFGKEPPVILKRKDLKDEDIKRIEDERKQRNLNKLLPEMKTGQTRSVGRIGKILCNGKEVTVNFESGGKVTLFTVKDFQSLELMVFKEGIQSFDVGCGVDLKDELVVASFTPIQNARSKFSGTIDSLVFMPSEFRLMTADEMAKARTVIVEAGPPTNLQRNVEVSTREQAEYERRSREAMLQQLRAALRTPLPGETRFIGTVEKVECSGQNMTAIVNAQSGVLKLKVGSPQELRLGAFTPDAAEMQFRCGSTFPGLKAVITYLPNTDKKKPGGDLKALEFVPPSFDLGVEP